MRFLLLKIPEKNNDFTLFTSKKNPLSSFPPLGLQYIAASLEKEGHSAEIIDLDEEHITRENLKNLLLTSDVVCLSVFINNYSIAADVSKEIKQIDANIPLIIGGPHCTFLRGDVFSHIPYADISVESEGELVILDLVQYFEGKKKLSDIPGIQYKEKKKITSGKPFEVIKDINSLPFPARHLTEKYEHLPFYSGLLFKKKFTTLLSSRGCPNKCRFCTRFGNIKGWTYRRRSPENIIQEMQEISEKYNSVMIVDDNFLADKKSIHIIMDKLIEMDIDLELYILGARVDTAEYDLYNKMKKAGVKFVGFGIESGNQDVLNYYNKKITLPQIRKAVTLSREMDFVTLGFFIFGAPFETRKHIENTIEFARSLPFDLVIFQPLGYEIGSDIWEDAVNEKKISRDDISVLADIQRGLGNFTQQEYSMFIKNGYRRFYSNPKYISRLLYDSFLHRNTNHIKTIMRLALSKQVKQLF